MSFGKRLRELREEKGLTQEELGDKINLKKAVISKYENDKLQPSIETINFFAAYFDVSTDYLLGVSDIRETPEKRIESAVSDDAELSEFWDELKEREDLQLLFKQVKPLPPDAIKRIVRYIKMVEDEEQED